MNKAKLLFNFTLDSKYLIQMNHKCEEDAESRLVLE